MSVGPLDSELVVSPLYKDLGIKTATPGFMCRIDCCQGCICLRVVGAIVLALKADVPLPLVENYEIFSARHKPSTDNSSPSL